MSKEWAYMPKESAYMPKEFAYLPKEWAYHTIPYMGPDPGRRPWARGPGPGPCMVWYGMVWYGMVWYGMVW